MMSAPFRQGREPRFAKHLAVLASVILAYLAGAVLGATAIGRWRWSLLVPCAVLALIVVMWELRPKWFAAIENDVNDGP